MRALGGEIILRIEDLDQARAAPGAGDGIVRDLRWLGLDWDNELTPGFVQSSRFATYAEAIRDLAARGLVYPCYCSRRELREIASAPHGHTGPIYPGTCRSLTPRQRSDRERIKRPALRLAVEPGTAIGFNDIVAGEVTERIAETSGDFIIARADGVPSYQLAVVLDDIAMGISHVLRGDDLLPSTPRQILLHRLFGAEPPAYAHVPLIYGPDGARLAKRHASISIAELRGAGHAPERITGWLAWSCGLRATPAPCTPSELIGEFSAGLLRREPTILRSLDIP